MVKKLMILGLTLAVVLVALFVYRQANLDLESIPQETIAPPTAAAGSEVDDKSLDENIEIVDQERGIGFGKAEGLVFVKPGAYEIRFARRVAAGPDTIQLSEPQVTLYYPKVVMQITAETLTMPAEFADIQSNLPRSGSLQGQVKLLLYPVKPKSDQPKPQPDTAAQESSEATILPEPQVTIELDQMNYTREFSRLTSNGSVRIKAEKFNLTGSDLTLQYDQINDRLQELQLRHLDKLQIDAKLIDQTWVSAGPEKTARTKKEKTSSKNKDKQNPINTYRLSLSKNVIISQKQEKLIADSLEIITEIDSADIKSTSESPSPEAEGSKVADSADGDSSDTDSTAPAQQAIEYAELTCDGPLRIVSLDEKPSVVSQSRRLDFTAHGQPAIIQRNNETVVSADIIRYSDQNKTTRLQASVDRPVILRQGPHQYVTAQKEINFDSRTGLATLFGPGQVEYLEKDKNSPSVIKYSDQMIIKTASSSIATDTATSLSESSPEWMEFNGRLDATLDLVKIQADRGRITFLPATKSTEESSSSPKVKTVELTGNIYMSDPNNHQFTADRLDGSLDLDALAADPNADITKAGLWLITGSPARVKSDQQGQIQGEKIKLDLAKGQCVIDGPGEMTAQIDSDLVGTKTKATEKIPIQINWRKKALYRIDSESITLEDVTTRIEQQTASTNRQSILTCPTMDITLTTNPNDPNSQDQRLNQFVAQGPQVILTSREYDKTTKKLLSDMQMKTSRLRFDNNTERLTTDGPGWIEMIDIAKAGDPNKPDSSQDGSLDKLISRSLASSASGAPSYTLVHFLGPMLYDVNLEEVSFTDGLALHRIPIDDPKNVASIVQDPAAWATIQNACQLHCDNLNLNLKHSSKSDSVDTTLGGNADVNHLYAQGNVVFEFVKSQKREFLAGKSFSFDNESKDIILTGSETMPVRFNQAQMLQFKYNLATGAYSGTPIGPSIIIN